MTKIRIAVGMGNSKLIKVSRMWSSLLLLGAALLSFGGCDQIMSVLGIGGRGALTMTPMPVSVKGCKVADPINAHPGDPVTWSFSDKSYEITFDKKYDPNSNPPNKDITPSLTSPTPQSRKWDTTGTPTDCSVNITTNKNEGCYFKYSISVVGGQVCNDPGVHIVP
jgi:hypothetical protein